MNDADCTIREYYKLHNSLNLQLYNQTLDQLQEYLYLSTFKYEYLLLYLISVLEYLYLHLNTTLSTCMYVCTLEYLKLILYLNASRYDFYVEYSVQVEPS